MPQWVEPMPSLIGVSSKVFTGHTALVIHQAGFDTGIILSRAGMKGYTLKKWESTLNSMFMPMDTM